MGRQDRAACRCAKRSGSSCPTRRGGRAPAPHARRPRPRGHKATDPPPANLPAGPARIGRWTRRGRSRPPSGSAPTPRGRPGPQLRRPSSRWSPSRPSRRSRRCPRWSTPTPGCRWWRGAATCGRCAPPGRSSWSTPAARRAARRAAASPPPSPPVVAATGTTSSSGCRHGLRLALPFERYVELMCQEARSERRRRRRTSGPPGRGGLTSSRPARCGRATAGADVPGANKITAPERTTVTSAQSGLAASTGAWLVLVRRRSPRNHDRWLRILGSNHSSSSSRYGLARPGQERPSPTRTVMQHLRCPLPGCRVCRAVYRPHRTNRERCGS